MRLENSAMAGVAVAIGFIIAGGLKLGDAGSWVGIILAIVSVFMITGAGNTINDYYDRDADRKNAPHRPIPSGDISPRHALYLAMILFLAGVFISSFINYACLALAGFNSILLFLYGRNLKSSFFVGNVAVSYLTASTFIYGALVIQNPLPTIFLVLLAFLVNVGREMIGDAGDIEGDRKAGITTIATRLGIRKTWLYGRAYIVAAILLSPIPYLTGIMDLYYVGPVLIADGIFVVSIITSSAKLNQQLTKIGMFIGLVAFLLGAVL